MRKIKTKVFKVTVIYPFDKTERKWWTTSGVIRNILSRDMPFAKVHVKCVENI